MSVQLILLEDVADLGKIGDEVHVANGYARNYLLPLKKAEIVTTAARRRVEAKKLKLQKEHEERVAVAQAMADKIAQLTLTIPVAAGENDKLYGSVSAAQIAFTNCPREMRLVSWSGGTTLLMSAGSAAWMIVLPMPRSANDTK